MSGDVRKCMFCGTVESRHYNVPWHSFCPEPPAPELHEIVAALAVTTWTCPHCGREQDVWGEGAVNGWMDCQSVDGCPASWLSLDLGIAEALGLTAPVPAGPGSEGKAER